MILLAAADEDGEISADFQMFVTLAGAAFSAADGGYFRTFQKLRDALLERGVGFLCAGALENAVQSAMACGSDRVYLTAMEEPARLRELMSLWEPAEPAFFPDTAAQDRWLAAWEASLCGKET